MKRSPQDRAKRHFAGKTDEEVKQTFHNCHDMVNVAGCFSSSDCIILAMAETELIRRGYVIDEERNVTIEKA
jgi:hypothetical protein